MVEDVTADTGELHFFAVEFELEDGVVLAEGGDVPALMVGEDVGDLFSNAVVMDGSTCSFPPHAALTLTELTYY